MSTAHAAYDDPGRGVGTMVALHGFGQNRHCWPEPLATVGGGRWLTLDLPGHGGAGALVADLWGTADLVAAAIGECPPPVTLLGYSFGGRVALHVAMAHPEMVHRLVLVSATAGIDDHDERSARRRADAELADRIEAHGVEAFVEYWLSLPMFAGLSEATAFRSERLANPAAGLAASLRRCGTGSQEPLWERLNDGIGAETGRDRIPVLVVAGEHDTKFVALARRLAAAIGTSATLEIIGAAGHSAHLEQPELFAGVLGRWLDSTSNADQM